MATSAALNKKARKEVACQSDQISAQPLLSDDHQLLEHHFISSQVTGTTDGGKFALEFEKFSVDISAAGDAMIIGGGVKKISDDLNNGLLVIVMRFDILAA